MRAHVKLSRFGGLHKPNKSFPSLCPFFSSIHNFRRPRRRRTREFLCTIDTSRANTNKTVVSMCSESLGFIEYPNGREDDQACDIYWFSTVPSDMKTLIKSPRSLVNKFPGISELSKKVSLTHAISTMQMIFPEDYNFYPRSFFLPADYDEFTVEKDIYTPDIYFCDMGEIYTSLEYVMNPFLMKDQLKFDFRIYAVLKSLNPLAVYVAREGMARFCTEKYKKPTSSEDTNFFSHLTNYSLNKAHLDYKHSDTLQEQATGSKRPMTIVFKQMADCGLDTKRLWHDIKIIVVKTIIAMIPEVMINYEHFFHGSDAPQCFQIIGLDILVREDGVPMLLEVNASPSLTIDHNPDGGPNVRSIVDEVGTTSSPKSNDDLRPGCSSLKESVPEASLHVGEVFPCRYEFANTYLFLDKMVYIFLQFVNVRVSMNITKSGLRRFFTDCGIGKHLVEDELERRIAEISNRFTGDPTNTKDHIVLGLPFHGFFLLMKFIAERLYPKQPTLRAQLASLLIKCDGGLRSKGVRSRRLRREEVSAASPR
ncbi:unnamed protein product [Heligmosomoides polygyrus]|uniref:Tubulin polyglutamylase TTLL11 n=1 Tax=Heligmosomoides polygyrus TaxID=6339 RepID=A0A3P7ZTE5_HELPZ|nr:unnamed protein product [Heligmosomoides polygyrus]